MLSSSNIDAAEADTKTESDKYSLSENVCTVADVSVPNCPPVAVQYELITESALKYPILVVPVTEVGSSSSSGDSTGVSITFCQLLNGPLFLT